MPSIADYMPKQRPLSPQEETRVAFRQLFLKLCQPATWLIHKSLVNVLDVRVRGRLNPDGLGYAKEAAEEGSDGQSGVIFNTLAAYSKTSKDLRSVDLGGAEYANTLSPEAEALSFRIAELHHGVGAIISSTGLSAITTTIDAIFARMPKRRLFPRKPVFILPEDEFFAPARYLREAKGVKPIFYPSRASADDIDRISDDVLSGRAFFKNRLRFFQVLGIHNLWRRRPDEVTVWVDAPGSGTGGIPDIGGIARVAKAKGMLSVFDNSGVTHVRLTPLDYGYDIEVGSLTKAPNGYGDLSGGYGVTLDPELFKSLAREQKIAGNGAIAPAHCARIFDRLNSLEERLDRQYETALRLMEKFAQQVDIVEEVISAARPDSPDHARFKEYLGGKGTGVFSVVFKKDIPKEKVEAFLEELALFRICEGFGAHVSLSMLLNEGERHFVPWPDGVVVRISCGLEEPEDLEVDVEQALTHIFGIHPEMRNFAIDRNWASSELSLA
jgi:cystathionine beta-lyase